MAAPSRQAVRTEDGAARKPLRVVWEVGSKLVRWGGPWGAGEQAYGGWMMMCIMPWCNLQCVLFEMDGVFDREPRGEFSLRGSTQGGCPLAATKRLLALDPVYPLHSKAAEGWEGGCHDGKSDMSGRSVEVEVRETDS